MERLGAASGAPAMANDICTCKWTISQVSCSFGFAVPELLKSALVLVLVLLVLVVVVVVVVLLLLLLLLLAANLIFAFLLSRAKNTVNTNFLAPLVAKTRYLQCFVARA